MCPRSIHFTLLSVCIKRIFYWGLFLRVLVQHWLLKFYMLYSFILHFAPSSKKRCYFSHGPPCTLYFQGIVCPKPCFLILIYHYPNSMSKTDSFKTFFICDAPYTYFESIRFSESCLLILLWHSSICLKLIYKF